MPKIEYVILANHAEALNGLLYIAGGGWTQLNRQMTPAGTPPVNHLGIGVSILVPWTETNRNHRFTLHVEPEDGGKTLLDLEADLEMGRPAGATPGSDLRAVLAVNGEVQFPEAGGYRVVARMQEQTITTSFRVVDLPAPVLQQP